MITKAKISPTSIDFNINKPGLHPNWYLVSIFSWNYLSSFDKPDLSEGLQVGIWSAPPAEIYCYLFCCTRFAYFGPLWTSPSILSIFVRPSGASGKKGVATCLTPVHHPLDMVNDSNLGCISRYRSIIMLCQKLENMGSANVIKIWKDVGK